MEITLDNDPLFDAPYNWFPNGPNSILMMPSGKGTASYSLSDEAVDKFNAGHKLSAAKLAKLQQICRFKAGRGEIADVKLQHL